MQNFSHENEFDLHQNERAVKTHFHYNGFTRRLVLTLRKKTTRKWSINYCIENDEKTESIESAELV